jgi:hypothetical protein
LFDWIRLLGVGTVMQNKRDAVIGVQNVCNRPSSERGHVCLRGGALEFNPIRAVEEVRVEPRGLWWESKRIREPMHRQRLIRISDVGRIATHVREIDLFSTQIPQEVKRREEWRMSFDRFSVFILPFVLLDRLHLAVVPNQQQLAVRLHETSKQETKREVDHTRLIDNG